MAHCEAWEFQLLKSAPAAMNRMIAMAKNNTEYHRGSTFGWPMLWYIGMCDASGGCLQVVSRSVKVKCSTKVASVALL